MMQEMITNKYRVGMGIQVGTKHGPIRGVITRFGNVYIGIKTTSSEMDVDIRYSDIQYFNDYNIRDCDLGV